MKGEQQPWHENEETPNREEGLWRKTRTPAPRINKTISKQYKKKIRRKCRRNTIH
jgi:hypothetical protein